MTRRPRPRAMSVVSGVVTVRSGLVGYLFIGKPRDPHDHFAARVRMYGTCRAQDELQYTERERERLVAPVS